MSRLDVTLVERGLAKSREKAKAIIREGSVSVNGAVIKKPSYNTADSDEITVISSDILRFVSRGGLKLRKAITEFQIDVQGKTAIDFGSSTGGFSQCLLELGASHIYAVDSGSNQFDMDLYHKYRDRITLLENTNARYLTSVQIPEKCDMAVMDVSFISQTLLYDRVSHFLKEGAPFISLIKPQFELEKRLIGKNGIVKDERLFDRVFENIKLNSAIHGLILEKIISSPIQGGDGNREFLGLFRKG